MRLKYYKRIYNSLGLLFINLLIFSTLSGQIRLAAAAGIHESNLIQKNSIPGFETAQGQYFSPKTGFQLGVLAEIPLNDNHLYLQPGIFYSAKGNQYEKFYDSAVLNSDTLYSQHTLSLNYVEMPFYLTWKKPLSKNGKNQFYLSAGPYFAFIMGASQTYQNRIQQYNSNKFIYQTGTEDLPVGNGEGQYKTFDIGISTKAGFEFGNVLIGAYFNHGFTNVYTATYPSGFHNEVFGGSIGIWLNKVKPVEKPIGDEDKDGTPDTEDSCISISGPPRWHGCPVPDTDLDGVNDEEDSCKQIRGPKRYHGCPIPDTDQDGIDDESDSCRNVPGSKKYLGCPVPDRDQDGVDDETDNCPDQAGTSQNNGCPVVHADVEKRAEWVAENVTFKTNSTQLTKSSYAYIIELADTLKSNPELNISICGYTDNVGNSGYNIKLSNNRAKSIKSVLVQKGITPDRITTKGYGDTQPIADNSTASGRAKNRRVVFVFELKNR